MPTQGHDVSGVLGENEVGTELIARRFFGNANFVPRPHRVFHQKVNFDPSPEKRKKFGGKKLDSSGIQVARDGFRPDAEIVLGLSHDDHCCAPFFVRRRESSVKRFYHCVSFGPIHPYDCSSARSMRYYYSNKNCDMYFIVVAGHRRSCSDGSSGEKPTLNWQYQHQQPWGRSYSHLGPPHGPPTDDYHNLLPPHLQHPEFCKSRLLCVCLFGKCPSFCWGGGGRESV